MKRRDFLKASALFGGVMILPSALAAKVKGANSRANIAIIGWGGQGKSSVDSIFNSNDANIVALCDVDEGFAAYCYRDDRGKFLMQNIGSLPKFKDYRVMLDKIAPPTIRTIRYPRGQFPKASTFSAKSP